MVFHYNPYFPPSCCIVIIGYSSNFNSSRMSLHEHKQDHGSNCMNGSLPLFFGSILSFVRNFLWEENNVHNLMPGSTGMLGLTEPSSLFLYTKLHSKFLSIFLASPYYSCQLKALTENHVLLFYVNNGISEGCGRTSLFFTSPINFSNLWGEVSKGLQFLPLLF